MSYDEIMNDLSFEFNSPMTKEDWDKLQDNEMEDTEEVTFKTPSGKRVPFRKVKHGEWKLKSYYSTNKTYYECSACGGVVANFGVFSSWRYCPHCGADMREGKETE